MRMKWDGIVKNEMGLNKMEWKESCGMGKKWNVIVIK